MDIKQEKILLELIKAGDQDAFGTIYDHYYPKLINYAYRRTLNIEGSEDIIANTFVKALNAINKFKWYKYGLSPWLYKITNNEINNYYRENQRYHFVDDADLEKYADNMINPDSEIATLESELMQCEDFQVIQVALRKLNLRYQEIIQLKFFEEKSYAELELILGIKQTSIRSLISRALTNLRDILEKDKLSLN